MQPVFSVEFSVKAGDQEFKEESVVFHAPEELFAYIAKGGGCEAIPDEVDEIQMVFLQPEHADSNNSIADKRVTLELGMVYLTGSLVVIIQIAEQLIEKADRGELSDAFLKALNVSL